MINTTTPPQEKASFSIPPGAMVTFAQAGSSGSYENEYGIGDVSLYLYRPGDHWPWVDLGCIFFANSNVRQYEDMQTAPNGPAKAAYTNYHRRLSKKQAEYIQTKISAFLMAEFQGVIPADDEIDDLMRAAREAQSK